MRLTLRTMLAYMDEILEPDDAEDIGKKIDESELAKTVMHRTRDAMRRMRLAAPPLAGRGMGLDPNSVAEYLDNTLPPEQVPDFERICLESDVHLAEVGSCHQILTLVLGEPADVDADSRERMYGVIEQSVAAPPVAGPDLAPPVVAPPLGEASTAPARRARPEVPDYLREQSSRSWATAAVVLILALFGGGIAAAVLSPQVREMVAGLWPAPAAPDRANLPGEDEDDAGQDSLEPAAGNPDAPGSDQAPGDDRGLPATIAPDDSAAPDQAQPVVPGDGNREDGLTLPFVLPDNEGAPPDPDELMNPTLPPTADNTPPDAAGPDVAGPAVPVNPADDAAEANPPGLPGGEALGRYLYKQDVVLRFDRRSESWRRLAPMALLLPGDRLMALPLFRPAIPLSTGVTIEPVDASVFELLGLDDNGVPVVSLDYGRLILFTAGKPRNQIRLRVGDHDGLITFGDGESTMAIEARRLLVPGKDPARQPGPLMIELYSTSGDITWLEAGASQSLRAPANFVLSKAGAEAPGHDLPKWTHGEPLTQVEQRAASALDRDLTGERPTLLTLKELSEARRVEVRSFATRCAAYLGDFEPFVTALNDPDQKLAWPSHIETLKAALARGSEAATKVREAFEKHRGADSAELYRMLWGYTADELGGGEAAKLVENLNHDSLDFRVLAFNNLHEITGMTLFYRPEYPPAKRRKEFLKWKEKLREGKIVPVGTAAAAAPRGPAVRSGPKPPATEPAAAP